MGICSLNGNSAAQTWSLHADLFGMFIPYQSILIPLVKFMQYIKLYWRHSEA